MLQGVALAQWIVKDQFEGVVDKGGNAYIGHIFRVYQGMDTEDKAIVALLHDVVEDTDFTLEELSDLGYSDRVVAAIDALTRRDQESYMDFIRRVKENELATEVKKADLCDNMNIKRIPNPSKKDYNRIEKYKKALKILNEE